MSKLVFAIVWLLVGLGLLAAVRRRRDLLPGALQAIVPAAVLALAVAPPALIFIFSVFRVIPAGHEGRRLADHGADPAAVPHPVGWAAAAVHARRQRRPVHPAPGGGRPALSAPRPAARRRI